MDEVLYVPAAARSAHGRGAERRRGASALLQSVISALSVASGPASVRERFEQELRSMVRARAVAVCEGSSAQQPAGNVMVFDIPSVVLAQCARIEIVFDPGRTLDGWTCELLEAATHVAALVLEIERALGRPPQFARIRRDGAAPLIGSSRAIRQVRERIERVAATDFTILIEGGIGPQPHPNFIEVFCPSPLDDGNGEVAGAGEDRTNVNSCGGRSGSGQQSRRDSAHQAHAFQACSFNHSDISPLFSFLCRTSSGCGRAVHQVHSRTPVLLTLLVRLPSTTATGRWRERGSRTR